MSQFAHDIDESTSLSFVLKKLFLERDFLFIRILIAISLFSGLISIFYRSYILSCQLSVIQNALLPFIDTRLILYALRFPRDKNLSILGIKLGILIGGISAFLTLLIDNLYYDFGGDREAAFLLRHQPVPPLNFELLWVGLGSQIFLWLFLILISAIAGLVATIRLRKKT